jgi:hypothetical protein
MSQPAEPDALSFLTTLPAEIRNAVFAILFTRDDPVEIVDREEQRACPEWLEDLESSDEDGMLELDDWETPKTHDLDQGINLLRTCRQIYWEAIRTLYTTNSFCVTASKHRHNWDVFQIRTAADFVESIGTHMLLITELSIDLGRFCPWTCHQETEINILPLLRILWSRPSIIPRVSFIAGKSRLSPEIHDEYDYEDEPLRCATQMNQVIRALSSTDQLNLRQYGRFERFSLFTVMAVNYPEYDEEIPSGGSVYSNHGKQIHRCWRFEIDETAGTPNWSSDPVRPLTKLPLQAYDRILHFALAPSDKIEFDLSNGSVVGLERSLLQLDKLSRQRARVHLARLCQITLRMETSEVKTSFEDFEGLREWLKGSYGLILDQVKLPQDLYVDVWVTPRILLHFKSSHATLAGLRINVKTFIHETYCMDKNTLVRISMGSTEARACTDEAYEIDLQSLRRRCFILLSVMLLQQPGSAHFAAPDIWIDGTGNPIEIVAPKAGRLKRGSDFPLTATALQTAGIDYIKKISRLYLEHSWPFDEGTYHPRRHPELMPSPSLMSL